MDVTALVARFHSEDKCREYLEHLRWPDGVHCPRCDASRGISRIKRRGQFDCDSCGYQFSVRVGTAFQDSHLPLWKWLLAVYVMAESRNGISANRLKRILDVSYKTAWHLSHRIRAAMRDEVPRSVSGIRRVDVRRGSMESLVGSYHHLSEKHLPAYLDEMAFRNNNRQNAYLFRDMLLRLIGAEPTPYADLIASA